ncbi:hypothetical protein Q8A67_020162 [Cirrhinus molitorella]|uniref:Uncharacterized protein n=1 Tax=Cirrhinus molitorella TaxID=172907 RepID=A0AA88TGQ4_9TELE|nr:hypothetical protein Q8A67_020162 [Cirrhinus molitorella]
MVHPQLLIKALISSGELQFINTVFSCQRENLPEFALQQHLTSVPTTSSSDPCYDYNTLDENWRDIRQRSYQYYDHDDSHVEWSGWYRLYLNGESAQMSEWCVSYVGCGGETGLYLNGSHPTLEDGVVNLEVLGSSMWSNQCGTYTSMSIQVKACPGDYYIYEFVKPNISAPRPTYCAVTFQSISSDPCYNYESLDRPWRANNESGDWICDESFSWNGWYRLFYYGMNIQMPETCVNSYSCNTYYTLWLNGPHPQIEDGVVTKEVCGSYYWGGCCDYKTKPIRVKACPGNYYVYELVNPQIWCAGYCTDVSTISQVVSTVSPDIITGSSVNLDYDPCNNYNTLDNHWRSTLNYWYWYGYINGHDDTRVEWDGWYRLFINGSSAQMPEWCFYYMSCGGYSSLWLGGSHPRLEDGVVTREIYGSRYDQCSYYRSEPVKVKACPGSYYVYKFTTPTLSIPAPVYCAVSLTTPSVDPCYNYTSLDEPWRATDNYYYSNYYYYGMCDYNVEWNGWYRLFYNGQNAQMPESCVNGGMCGTYEPLSLNGPHPQLEDGVVTRQVCLSSWSSCCDYSSHAIQVKACPGNYYVYEFVKPYFCGAYCAEVSSQSITSVFTTTETIPPPESITPPITTTAPPVDPCTNYNVLDDPWRATNNQHSSQVMCDNTVSWNGWYRLYIQGQSVQMPDTCVNQYSCGTDAPLWLNGGHPTVEDGVVTRDVCGHWSNNCCYFQSNPIKVKACPGDYYVYEFVSPTICNLAYCAESTTFSDPCYNYNTLDEYWRDIRQSPYQYYDHDDSHVEWSGWYRLYLNGESAQMSEWCVSNVGCGGYTGLYLNSSHPTLEDGVVTRDVLGSYMWSNQCGAYTSNSIQVKACPGDYYVYKFVKPDVSIYMPSYCAVTFQSISSDPCYNYESLDRPWRANNESGDYICDESFSWSGWYRLFYYGMNIQMPETCVNSYSCNTYYNLWLNGPHPQIEDGVVTREVCAGSYWSSCCDYKTNPIRVKACPGNYYVYELVNPQFWCAGYCTDVSTISQVVSTVSPDIITESSITLNYDACNNYNILDNHWRSTFNYWSMYGFISDHDDTRVEWDGWYRLFINGSSAQMPEWCFYSMSCGGFSSLYLGGSHPRLEDGVVTREVVGSRDYQCSRYRSEPIQVKACPGDYYVYKFTRPTLSIPAPVYCAVNFSTPSVDPCYTYTSLDEPWRATDNNNTYYNGMCDYNVEWNGWYRLFYNGQNAQMPESCVNYGMCGSYNPLSLNGTHPQLEDGVVTRQDQSVQMPDTCVDQLSCGTHAPLWLNGGHPTVEDGVVTRDVCGHWSNNCCFFQSNPIKVKACPGDYYVYEFVNNNGHLTFDGSWSSYTPYQFPANGGKDLIAPFWTDLDNRLKGVISYQQYTSGSVLTQATQDINQYFPELNFSASWVFVVTWDRVAYFPNSGTVFKYSWETLFGVMPPARNDAPVPEEASSAALSPVLIPKLVVLLLSNTLVRIFNDEDAPSLACGNGLPYYRIEGKNEHRGSTHVSWTRMVRVFVYNEEIELVKDHYYEAKVNGTFKATPFSLHNGSIQVYRSGFSLVISTDFGLLVTYDAYSYVTISVPYNYQNATCGLCGNYNLHPEDDFRSVSGEILSSDVDFANSWKVKGDTDPECHDVRCTGLGCVSCTPDEMSLYSDTNHCGILGDIWGPFASCHSVFSPETYIQNCVYDLCLGGGYQPILCQALNVYAAQCQQQGVQLGQWRQPGFCEIQCPEHSHFESQGTSCPATCSNPSAPINCPLPNQESCVCDNGYILSAGQCVPEANCGCVFEGFYYSQGQSVVLDEDCGRQCVCSSRSMVCYEHQCGPAEVCGLHNGVRGCRPISYATCSVEGLGSYYTFDGQTFRYPGACGLTLARVMGPSQLPYFVLTVEKVPRGLQEFSRFLKFEAGETHISIELGEGSNVQVDGQMVRLPISVGSSQIHIYHSSARGFVLETNFGVTIRADWPHIVRITAPTTYNGTLGGLCGNLNGNTEDEFYSPDGILLDDSQLFADSWRDGSLSAHCEDPTDIWEPGLYQNRSEFSEHCSIMARNDGPFSECSRTLDPWQRIQDCIQMLEQTGGAREALCEALRGYTLHCQQNGIAVREWRSITHCDPVCPANTHFELCGTSCPASCPSLSFPFQCTLPCQGGCQCNDGLLLDGDRCVPPTGCGCRYNGRYRQPGEQFWHGEECQSLCVCDGITGNVRCTPSSCGEQESCRVVGGEYGCHPRPHGNCYASGDPHYISFDGTYFDFQGTCRYVLAKVCDDTRGLPHFQVDARNEGLHGWPVSITVDVFVNVSGHLVHMSQDMNSYSAVKVDEEIRNLPVYLDSGRVSVYSTGQLTYVSTDFGLSVSYGFWTVNIVVPADYNGVVCGICGNFNGHPEDDFLTPSGALAPSADQFGAEWMVEDDMSCHHGSGDQSLLCQDESTTLISRALCGIIKDNQGPFSFCHGYVDPQAYFDSCVFDVCISENSNNILCHSVQAYVSACQSANAIVYPWRENASCVMDCSSNMPNSHYEVCGTDCAHTCASSIDASCEHSCSEGCFCDEGFVRSGGLCVPVEQCGCLYDGFYYNIGEQFWDSTCSQRCECFAPNDLRCSASSCPAAMECAVRNGHRDCYNADINVSRARPCPLDNRIITGPFYSFGTGDTVNEHSDDGSSSVIYLEQPFIFFGQTYNQIYVNNNGHLTFDEAWYSYSPYQFPAYSGKDVIAPFWTDIDNRWNGIISYQQYTSGSVLTQATQDINQYFPHLSFSASWVFVATWDRVAYFYNSGTETSFQVVLISNGHLSFVVMNYGAIAPTGRYVQAGYDTVDSSHHFSITGSLQNDITSLPYSSNVNVPGRWAFRTDHGTRGCQYNGFQVQLGDSFWSDAACQEKCTCTRGGLQCSFEPCSYSQACRPAAFQYSCQNIPRQTCTISGDPHYYTFDNQIFHFQGTCTYVLSESCGSDLPYYRIEGKNEHRGSTHVSWTRMVRVFVYNEVIELVKDHYYEAKVNGTFIATPFSLHGGSIQVYQSGFSLAISTDFGLLVTYDAYSYVTISIPYNYQNATCGLCGNYNLHPEDDFRSVSGEILSSDVEFANSWKVEGDTDPECHDVRCTGLACAVCSANEMSLYSDTNHCGILGDVFGPFASCHSVFSPQTYVENCVYDLCLGGGYQPILCQALNVYAAQCQQQGVQLGQWRQPGFCEIQCPEHSHFESQGNSCPATCSNPSAPINCPLPNQESCVCNNGYMLSAGQCVPEANCGCVFEGFYYSEGQSVVLGEDCGRQCTCSSRSMVCYEHQCGPAEMCGLHNGVRGCRPISYATCSVESLGSYHTFDGQTFRYPGACGLTLARVMGPSQLPYFVLTVEKVPRGLQDFSRFLKFEAGGTHVSIELGEGSNVQVDGQMVGLPISVGSSQIHIYHSSARGFVLETSFGVTIRADWPHIVRITAPTTYNGTLGGLCGNLNENIDDEFYSPDGVLQDDSQLFADSWRDGSLSAHCVDPIDNWEPGLYQNRSEFSEHCSIMTMNDGPFAECSRTLDPWQRVEDCIQMLEQTDGAREALCEALRGYSLHCQQNGIPVGEWRSITHCDPNCPANTHFELCGTSCPASCPSLSFPFQCTLPCQGGCQCNDGLVLDGDHCVPPTGCGCHYEGRYRQPGEQFWHGEECQSLCVCDGITGNVRCTPSSCSEQEICRVVDGEYGCHPRPHGNCYASGDPHYLSFDGTYFDFQGTCRYVLATVCDDTRGLPHFQVDARNEAWNGWPVSITVDVFVNVSGHLVHMSQEMNSYSAVKVDEEIKNLPVYLDSGRVSVYSTGQFIYVSTDFGFSVSYGGSWEVNIVVPADYNGVMCGICGNFNGHPEDDFLTPSGALASSADQFGAEWMIEDDISRNPGCGAPDIVLCQDEISQALCGIIRDNQGPFSFCHGFVDPQAYFDSCVYDVCISGNHNDVSCRSVQSYVSACQSANAIVYPWRETASCVMDCSSNIPNSHYEVCGTDCAHTCASSIDASCEHSCSEGCFCDEGFVRSGGLCVPVEQCGCLYDGFYYNIGEQFWDPRCSQRCECFAPNDLRCSASSCPAAMECAVRNGHRDCYSPMSTCTVWGDPHYLTFDGAVAHFQGTCSYEIAHTCGNITDNDLEFSVVATNRHRGNTMVSFVSAVDVWLSQHGQETRITIGQNRRVKVDENTIDTPAYQNDLVEIHEEQGFIILNAFNEFIVHFDGHSSLLIRVSERFHGSLCGMCGNFNGNPSDDKVLPSGDPAPDDDSFGQSWKSPTSIPGCGASDRSGNADECPSRQRYSYLCSIITNTTGPFQNCHLHVDPAPYYYSCVYDLCLYTRANGMLCSAVEAYETACALLEIQIPEWRSGLRCDVKDRCSELSCSENEWCGKKNGVYGCMCNDDLPRPQPDSFDFSETCESSSGSMSVSRCQLFEAGFPADNLHLSDSKCKGTVRNGRVEFHFDNDEHLCGTKLVANGTHFIYDNFILGTPRSEGLISREKILKLSFSCVYPQTQKLSMNVEINPLETFVNKTLPSGEGRYQVRMIPYEDDEFTRPFTGKVDAELNQEMHVEVRVEGVDSRQFALVMDRCWATPVNDPDYSLHWDLIINECPNPNDDTVELLQNGVSTSSRFSFRMFIFTANSTKLYLHCAVHLCLQSSNSCSRDCNSEHHWRKRRSLDFHDSASISMGPLVLSQGNTDNWLPGQVKVSEASCLCSSLMLLLVPLMSFLALF